MATDKVGDEQEKVFDAEVNSGFFSAILESGDVQATFVGHDHVSSTTTTKGGNRILKCKIFSKIANFKKGFNFSL